MVEKKDVQQMTENSPQWAESKSLSRKKPKNTHAHARTHTHTHTHTHTRPYIVLVVTNAVPPSSVAGSGILCSLTVLHVGSPLPPSVPAYFVGSLFEARLPSHCEPAWAPRWGWEQGEGAAAPLCSMCAWPFPCKGWEWIMAGGSVFWGGSCCCSASSATHTAVTWVHLSIQIKLILLCIRISEALVKKKKKSDIMLI